MPNDSITTTTYSALETPKQESKHRAAKKPSPGLFNASGKAKRSLLNEFDGIHVGTVSVIPTNRRNS